MNTGNTNEKNLNPLVIARDGEQLDLVTWRDDRKAGFVGWRIHWTGEEPDAYREIGARLAGGVYHYDDAPEVYYLVETCSQQYSEEYTEPTYGTQVWRVARGEITHDAWFAWGSSDPAKAVKELADVYTTPTAKSLGIPTISSVDPDSLRVVESDNACCYLVY